MTSRAGDVWQMLQEAYGRFAPQINEELVSKAGISLAWYNVLSQLSGAPSEPRMSDLASRVVLSRTRVSRQVDELIAARLLLREPNPADGRSFVARLTTNGRKVLSAAAPIYEDAVQRRVFAGLSQDDLNRVQSALQQVLGDAHTPRERMRSAPNS